MTQFVTVSFDVNQMQDLPQTQSNQIKLQYCPTKSDVKSFEHLESEQDEEMSDACKQFCNDREYHVKYVYRNSTDYGNIIKRQQLHITWFDCI